jgi:hypothetical protein
VYSPKLEKAVTVQVKTCLRPKAAGGRGKPALDWWLRRSSPAELVGIVNLENNRVWLFSQEEFVTKAQQHIDERMHLYFYVDPGDQPREGYHKREFEPFRLERRISTLLRLI